MISTTTLICVMIFVTVAALVGVISFVLRDTNPKTNQRLDTLVGKRRASEASTDILRKTAFESDKKSLIELLTPKFLSLNKFFEQADCHIKPSTLIGVGAVLGALGFTGSWLARVPWFFMPLTGLLLFLVPLAWVWNKRRARLKNFASQLPDALELVARALRAGHSLGAGMHVVAEEMPTPIAEEFGRVYE